MNEDETLAALREIRSDIAEIRREIRELREERTAPQIAVTSAEAAKMIRVPLKTIYVLHHTGELSGFRATPRSELRFLVSDLHAAAQRMSRERRNA